MVNFRISKPEAEKDIEFSHEAKVPGEIELKRVSESLNTLTIYLPGLNLIPPPPCLEFDEAADDQISVMLTNYPVKASNLDKLHSVTIELDEGWQEEALYTMVTFRDGESINKNRITIHAVGDGLYEIKWTGQYSAWHEDYGDRFMELNMRAMSKDNVHTPLS